MNEHYAAARNQQVMRLQSMALYVSASSILFVQAVIHNDNSFAGYVIGFVLIVLATLCAYKNFVFHNMNRYHVEIARQSRNQITKILEGGTSLAQNRPNLIGDVVRANPKRKLSSVKFDEQLNLAHTGTLADSPFKVEGFIFRSLLIIPALIGTAGLILLGYFMWIQKIICMLCRM